MDILYALEKIRTPFWNGVMSAVTQLGGEVIFIVAAVVVVVEEVIFREAMAAQVVICP